MRLKHGRATLELHALARREGPALLLLHALRGSSADWGEVPAIWPGPVFALDFCGHGHSDWIVGGAYYPELLAADADAALAQIGRAALAGAGVGAYVALLLAGTRCSAVPVALLLPGAGLAGGGAWPDLDHEFPQLDVVPRTARGHGVCDPMVRALEHDVRPIDYVEQFACAARRLLLVEDGDTRPPWWEAVRRSPSAETMRAELPAALARLAEATGER